MIMKVGIVAPFELIEKINLEIKNKFKYMEYTNIIYAEYKEAVSRLENRQKCFDAVLFGGQTPYNYAKKYMEPVIVWEYIPRHGSSLLNALLKASRSGYDISKASFDSYSSSLLYETYDEIGIQRENLDIYIARENPLEYGYLDDVYTFHKKNYEERRVSCCISALFSVHQRLCEEKIPCILLEPTINVIRDALYKLNLQHIAQINQNRQIVVLSIDISTPDEYSLLNYNEYQFVLDRMKISEQIYLFAEKIQAAVLEVSFNSYFLFSTRNILEVETDNFRKIDLFNRINKEALGSISMGIGYGGTAREAKYNANLGMLKAKKFGKNSVCVVYENEKMLGPIEFEGREGLQGNRIDEKILNIAEKSQIGVNTIFKLYDIINRYKQDCFTSKELAKIHGISVRNMDRILNKLEEAGFAKVAGKKAAADAGRPSRIMKLYFEL